ncbi:MAG: hypothetical protein N3F67_00985 [Acidilobaceae archaeon]|nr:hypothetical protein [Acidilobaceae archaeon]
MRVLLLLLALAQLALLSFHAEDPELGRPQAVAISDAVYAFGMRGNYLTVAKYSFNGTRLWLSTLDLKAGAEILSVEQAGEDLTAILSQRRDAQNILLKVRVSPKGDIAVEKRAELPPRLFPYDAVELGKTIYIAGSSYSFLTDMDFMVARVDEGLGWIIEEVGGAGDQGYRCILRAPGDRLLAVGVGGNSVVMTIVSQLGDVVGNYSLSFERGRPEVFDCVQVAPGAYAIVGRLERFPLVIRAEVSSSRLTNVSYSVVADLPGAAVGVSSLGGAAAVSIVSHKGPVLALYDMRGAEPRLTRSFNLSHLGREAYVLSSASRGSAVALGGARGEGGFVALFELPPAERGGPSLSFLDVIPTIILLLAIGVSLYAIYKRRFKKS